ncbi:hypothetical protein OHA37_07520 [Streptomyces sp. NBC_00335]|uniref:hypothetical protein n=1 Tax=unclassified Streptomyces TaxID=2593676 RepID=UPI002251A4D9|nr:MULTISPECIES: hypothetical protein [unclassified Streptomyces]MCX5403732.1 hypothetical protein [Streptomyces sp. NBC_00086]
MSTHRSRRIDRATAEQLLADARSRASGTQGMSEATELAESSGTSGGHEALAGLLAAAAAPAGKAELAGEQDALAMFRAARLAPAADPSAAPAATHSATPAPAAVAVAVAVAAPAPGSAAPTAPAPTPRKRSLRTPATLLGAKVAAAVLAAALGGVAVAAGTGNLPPVLGGAPAHGLPAASPAPATRVTDAPSPRVSGRPSAVVPADLAELCRAFTRAPGPRPEEALAEQRFAALVAAAGGRSRVPGYCTPVRGDGPQPSGSAPSASPTRNPRAGAPTHPGKPDPSRRPVTPGPGAGEHGPATRPPGRPSTRPSPPRGDVPTGRPRGANP